MPRPRLPAAASALLLICTACHPAPQPPAAAEAPAASLPDGALMLGVEEAAALLRGSPAPRVVDLREEWEIQAEGRLPGSVWADFLNPTRFTAAVAKLPPAEPCLLYCALGGRARLAAQKLAERGFTRIHVLDGGLEAWLRAGKPVER